MGASFKYASVDSLDMSWLPLSRFESRAVCVAVSCLRARAEGAIGMNKYSHLFNREARQSLGVI